MSILTVTFLVLGVIGIILFIWVLNTDDFKKLQDKKSE